MSGNASGGATGGGNAGSRPSYYYGNAGQTRGASSDRFDRSNSGEYGYTGTKNSGVQRLKRTVRQLRERNSALEADYQQLKHELQHYKGRVQRADESHRLEIARLKKEVDYHKRMRQGAEQRAFDLEDRLKAQQRHASSFDEQQAGVVEELQRLNLKNSEQMNKIKQLEAQLLQLQELKVAAEDQLYSCMAERDQLEMELSQYYSAQ
eukprot:CAMPEP_0202903402 /NCGR_PEP_ID=MMETSP1392-20130828/24259_1 /ASSEMBLY_ACC=CAM_ASM_000868 /TAXON_ID=225041 /ORGANISM="Chlamydomonas chlamydogama, Strain SAG 11-48b" /LENGTH=206 /DNA_ID=CAMNT_0049590559 /DNA_START=89 /DNA_END=706 /DNA_ORIENTATION=-